MTQEFEISPDLPILIAGPTASGKSSLALRLAEKYGGEIVNADSIQVFENWRILSARPDTFDEAQASHHLYGHIAYDADYSVGHWLRDLKPFLNASARPIIVGGTGLYFSALTEGLAEIPPTPAEIRAEADAILRDQSIATLLSSIDKTTISRIDTNNPMRVQRAWEVQKNTGRGLADWQDATPAPLLPLDQCHPIVLDAPKDWLTPRIEKRFAQMLEQGALDEVRNNLPNWDPNRLSSKAIGAPELVAHLRGSISLQDACINAEISTRQFAKRQRTWFRSRMKSWMWTSLPT